MAKAQLEALQALVERMLADQRAAAGLEPMMTQFGWQFERQLVSGSDGSQALLEWVFLFGGLEQSELNFSVTWIAGYRLSSGVEFGVETMVKPLLANAKPTAVPRNGAEQGVARTTASSPSKKLRRAPTAWPPTPASLPVPTSISNTPNRFKAKATSTALTATT